MFWFLYITSVLLFIYLIGSFSKRNYLVFSFICLVIFITPTQIEVGSTNLAPALFSFLFDVFLEKDYSLRALRPLVLSIPSSFFILLIFFFFKKRFF